MKLLFKNFKKTVIIIILSLSITTAFSQSWTQKSPPYNYTINSCWIDETSPNNGWFVGWRLAGADPVSYGYNTTNGGNSFTFTNFNYYFWLAQDVYFVNSNNGVVIGGGIIKTSNGGNSWNVTVNNIQMRGWMYDVMFTDANSGYSVGQTYDISYTSYWGVIYKTTDGGGSWSNSIITYENQNQNTEFRAIHSTGAGLIYAGGLNTMATNSLFKSTDNGNTWLTLNFFHDVNSIWFASADTGLIASDLGIFKTTDAGITWNNILPTPEALFSLNIKNNFGFAVGASGKIYKTIDNGVNWTFMTSPVTNQSLNRVFVVSDYLAYAVGTSGTILKYQNNMVGIEKETMSLKEFTLSQNYPNPFNPSTKIIFSIPKSESVSLTVYDASGREATVLVNEFMNAGSHEVSFNGSGLSSGVYFYTIKTNSFTNTKKMILTK